MTRTLFAAGKRDPESRAPEDCTCERPRVTRLYTRASLYLQCEGCGAVETVRRGS